MLGGRVLAGGLERVRAELLVTPPGRGATVCPCGRGAADRYPAWPGARPAPDGESLLPAARVPLGVACRLTAPDLAMGDCGLAPATAPGFAREPSVRRAVPGVDAAIPSPGLSSTLPRATATRSVRGGGVTLLGVLARKGPAIMALEVSPERATAAAAVVSRATRSTSAEPNWPDSTNVHARALPAVYPRPLTTFPVPESDPCGPMAARCPPIPAVG